MFVFTTRANGLKVPYGIDASSKSKWGLVAKLSPFSTGTFGIPVPGSNLLSNSVEGIWQGLKILDGKTDFKQFTQFTRKRSPYPGVELSGWLYGSEILDVVEARLKIYIPAFLYHWQFNVAEKYKDLLVDLAAVKESEGKDIPIYDFMTNGDIFNPAESYAHAHLVAYLLNGRYLIKEGKKPDPPFWKRA